MPGSLQGSARSTLRWEQHECSAHPGRRQRGQQGTQAVPKSPTSPWDVAAVSRPPPSAYLAASAAAAAPEAAPAEATRAAAVVAPGLDLLGALQPQS